MEEYILIGVFFIIFIYFVYCCYLNKTKINNYDVENFDQNNINMNNLSMNKLGKKTLEERTLDKLRKNNVMDKHLIYTKPLGTSNFNNHDIYHIINIHDTNDIRFNNTHLTIMISWLLNHSKFTTNNKRIFKYFDIHDKYMKMPLEADDYEKTLLINSEKCERIKRNDEFTGDHGELYENIAEIDNRIKKGFVFNHDNNEENHEHYEYYMIVVCGNSKDNVYISRQNHRMDDRCHHKLVGLADLMIKECNAEIKYMRMEDVIKRNNINFYQLLKIKMVMKDDDVYVDRIESRPKDDNMCCDSIDKLYLHLFKEFNC